MPPISRFLLLALTLSLVGCDHVTKHMAITQFQEAPRVFWGGFLQFTYTENRDMAFGLLSHVMGAEARLWLLTGIKTLAVGAGLVFLLHRKESWNLGQKVALAFITAGAAGNLIDRVLRGFVVDFVRVSFWPVFNVADVVIVAGFFLLALQGSLGVPSRYNDRSA